MPQFIGIGFSYTHIEHYKIHLFVEFPVQKGCTLVRQLTDSLNLPRISLGRHLGFLTVLIIELPDCEIGIYRFGGLGRDLIENPVCVMQTGFFLFAIHFQPYNNYFYNEKVF
mgnify:CR=1 FL=1